MGKSQSKASEPCVKFALVGTSGCGKSAFVNAIRGVDDEHEHAAPVDIVEKSRTPKEYIDPKNPVIYYWDPPGYGTPSYPTLDMYWKKHGLSKFDSFLIFISFRVTKLDLELINRVKSAKKSFLIIRTKIDVEFNLEIDKFEFREKETEETLEKIKAYVHKQTNLQSSSTEKVIFLISNYDTSKWDFRELTHAMNNLPSVPETATWNHIFGKEIAKGRGIFHINGIQAANKLVKELDKWKDRQISLAVVGKNGCGKSSFINAIRGITNEDDPLAAETGTVDTTKSKTRYSNPRNPNITLRDFPGIGGEVYSDVNAFCEKVDIKKYDAFIIMTSERFSNDSGALASELVSKNKPFFFVRTKYDLDCENEKKKYKEKWDELKTRKKIKYNCYENLKLANAPLDYDDIFVISNHHPYKWEFPRLVNAINDRLPASVRTSFLLSTVVFSEKILKRKVETLKGRVRAVALLQSSIVKVFTTTEYSRKHDFILIAKKVKFYRSQLGFPEENPKNDSEKDPEERPEKEPKNFLKIFEGMSPELQNDVRKFYFEPGTDMKSWLEALNESASESEPTEKSSGDEKLLGEVKNKDTYGFVEGTLHCILNEMSEVGQKILEEARMKAKGQ
ncbi:interferon-inducible GTPase 5-like isoform X3 [Dendronephthya gigantea]|nr:interferon-inducible GTPase 5-like isoform X2 [Dendronephthya gigantea]XP_028404407.1 interferon-inducible GTPase 5-like isoform X3 [Dendronephthya gigantea]